MVGSGSTIAAGPLNASLAIKVSTEERRGHTGLLVLILTHSLTPGGQGWCAAKPPSYTGKPRNWVTRVPPLQRGMKLEHAAAATSSALSLKSEMIMGW
jgi:hypothetical protein